MAKKSSYDDLETDYFDEEAGSSFLSLISLAVAFLAVAAFIALAWYAYQDDDSNDGSIETIYADKGEIRNAPEGETGWKFPDTDRQIYKLGSEEANDSGEVGKVEQILPQPERPQPRKQVGAEGWISKPKVEDAEIAITDAERRKMEEVAAAAVEKPAAKDKAVIIKEVVEVVKPTPTPVAVAKVVEKKVVKAAAPVKREVASGKLTRNRLQLGAFGSRSEALSSWKKILGKNSSLLDGKQAHVEAADVKGKTYYRVQLYPFANKAEADALCVMLKSRNQACFSVKR